MDSFILYRSTLDALRALPAEDFRDAVCMIADYDMDNKVPEKPGVAYALFLSVRPLIDKRKKCAEAGKKGGLKRVQNQQNATSTLEATLEAPLKRFQGKEERRKKKEEIIKEINVSSNEDTSSDRAVIDAWNQLETFGIPPIRHISPGTNRDKQLRARIREYGVDDVLETIRRVEHSKFLRQSSFFTFDWFIKPNNYQKTRDGNYDDRKEAEHSNRISEVDSWV